jgi:hypothetical protein
MIKFLISEDYRIEYSKDFCERLDWEQEQEEAIYTAAVNSSSN